jgi:hypothetical protein
MILVDDKNCLGKCGPWSEHRKDLSAARQLREKEHSYISTVFGAPHSRRETGLLLLYSIRRGVGDRSKPFCSTLKGTSLSSLSILQLSPLYSCT